MRHIELNLKKYSSHYMSSVTYRDHIGF